MCPNEIGVTLLRNHQRDVFDDVLKGESFLITRAGESIAALINIDEYEAFSAWRREKSLNLTSSFAQETAEQSP